MMCARARKRIECVTRCRDLQSSDGPPLLSVMLRIFSSVVPPGQGPSVSISFARKLILQGWFASHWIVFGVN